MEVNDMILGNTRTKRRGERAKRATAVTFDAEDLAVLGKLLAAGQALLGASGRAPAAITKLKAAMTRLKVPVPRGL
jgi:hypothetical protein